jgi:hypothetical protein
MDILILAVCVIAGITIARPVLRVKRTMGL